MSDDFTPRIAIGASNGPVELGDISIDGLIAGGIREKIGGWRATGGLFYTSEAKQEAFDRLEAAIDAHEKHLGFRLSLTRAALRAVANDPWTGLRPVEAP